MRVVRIETWTSGEPVSPPVRPYSWINSLLRSFVTDICTFRCCSVASVRHGRVCRSYKHLSAPPSRGPQAPRPQTSCTMRLLQLFLQRDTVIKTITVPNNLPGGDRNATANGGGRCVA